MALIIHLALILYLRQAKIIIKILPFRQETEVAIAKYPEVNLPQDLQEVINQPPSSDLFPQKAKEKDSRAGYGASGAGGHGQYPSKKLLTGTTGQSGSEEAKYYFDLDRYLASGRGEKETGSDFVLTLTGRFRTIGKYNFSLKLPVRTAPPGEGEKGEQKKALKGDVYKYLSPQGYRQSGKGLKFSPAGKPIPSGLAGPGGLASTYSYDINPWAEKVVNNIQAKWVLPELSVKPENRIISLLLHVDRDGQLIYLEIINSTANELLDQAALSAVKLSAPFPPLPTDFPGKILEFSLIFTYHE
ncbi:MAG: TonB C-terminal domain-containing protein [Candidatus Aminicenantes bacterium]|nr:TonB C-terminal domain-containing protein [Candidatus Aminicenantes bacterium]